MLQILHKTNIDFMGWKNISSPSRPVHHAWHRRLIQIGRAKQTSASISLEHHDPAQLKEHVTIDKARIARKKSGFQGQQSRKSARETRSSSGSGSQRDIGQSADTV